MFLYMYISDFFDCLDMLADAHRYRKKNFTSIRIVRIMLNSTLLPVASLNCLTEGKCQKLTQTPNAL